MATKRNVLDLLSPNARAFLLNALTVSKKARLQNLLGVLPRQRLRELCRELDVDDVQGDEAARIERLTGRGWRSGTRRRTAAPWGVGRQVRNG